LDAEEGLSVVGEAANADEAVEQARLLHPTVVLLDIVMPVRSGLDALPEILEAAPDAKVLMLSMEEEPGYVRRSFASGASGYLLKAAADSELVQAVRDVAAGRRYVHPLLGARLAEAASAVGSHDEADTLSEREREVVRLLALGHTNQEIAKQLFISVRTAETHRAHIMRKLQLSTRAEIVRYALASGQLGAGPAAES
jgi:DNA-binding NarL/FixJ family response regulator